jgi:hypothetical protein
LRGWGKRRQRVSAGAAARSAARRQLPEPVLLDKSGLDLAAAHDEGHAHLVELYLRHAGFERIETHRLSEWVEDVSDPMIAVVGRVPAL